MEAQAVFASLFFASFAGSSSRHDAFPFFPARLRLYLHPILLPVLLHSSAIISISPSAPFSRPPPVPVPFWLTSSLASSLPFSVGSLEKLCALGGEHPFYTGPGRTRCVRGPLRAYRRAWIRACTLFFFFFSLPVSERVLARPFTTGVIEDLQPEWECHVDERN